MNRFVTILSHGLFALIVLAATAWAATALWLHLSGALRLGAEAALAFGALCALAARFAHNRRSGWAVLVIGALVVGAWYQTITPRDDRSWALDVSRGVKAQVAGDIVTLRDLRDFDWSSATQATPRWITGRYDLRRIETVDMFTSVWDNPDIAHLLVSFGFADGEHVVFSVEIRREAGEEFNEIGGFFRQFELVLIGATEGDIVKLRSNYRKEEVRMFPILLTPEQRRAMFLSYVALAQKLEARPAFYNTLTANCTTVVYQLATVLKPDLPLDWRLVLSGYLPDYLAGLGVLGGNGPLQNRKAAAEITARALRADPAIPFSRAIRQP